MDSVKESITMRDYFIRKHFNSLKGRPKLDRSEVSREMEGESIRSYDNVILKLALELKEWESLIIDTFNNTAREHRSRRELMILCNIQDLKRHESEETLS